MMKSTAALVLVTLVNGAKGASVSSKLQVHIPHTLTKEGGYDHREALFGVPPYGASLQQSVYYANSNFCDSNVDTSGGFPEREKDKDGKMKPWPSPYILMVDRGACSFVTKVRNAQHSGAAGVIIADNTCLCSSQDACTPDRGTSCEPREPIMADDGSGADIAIPSFLMFKQDADLLKAELEANKSVRVEMSWSLPSPDARVEYDLWTSPTDVVSHDFLTQFKEAAVALGTHAYFTPHMSIYDGIQSQCRDSDGANQCYNLCTNQGRYCATDPDNNLDKGISGADVVKESLRRACIWKHYGHEDGVGAQWWDYVQEFMYRCQNEKFFANDDCAKDSMSHAQIDPDLIDQCMSLSGGLKDDKENDLLQQVLSEKESSGVVIVPSVFVNGVSLRGALEFATVFKAVCAGFVRGSEPPVCERCAKCTDELVCVVSGKCSSDASVAISLPIFAASLGMMFFCFCIVGICQWQRSQRQMREQVKGILAEYMPLDESAKVDEVGIAEDEGEFS